MFPVDVKANIQGVKGTLFHSDRTITLAPVYIKGPDELSFSEEVLLLSRGGKSGNN